MNACTPARYAFESFLTRRFWNSWRAGQIIDGSIFLERQWSWIRSELPSVRVIDAWRLVTDRHVLRGLGD